LRVEEGLEIGALAGPFNLPGHLGLIIIDGAKN
jgi:hypothetical protein